jgi:superfamily I DNA/RNA helicase
MAEISIAIKGHGLERDKKRYVQSARHLSRFHGLLNESERTFVFDVFEEYHHEVFESLEVLDSDDLAISLLGRLRTPIWELRRRQLGYDFVFVDETQLFNENERRLIPLLTNGSRDYVPVVLALDEAQAIYGQSAAGFAALGIEGIASESLASIHRSTKSIVDLAFFVIQRSTDLFGPDFPNFTDIAGQLQSDSHPLAARPRIEFAQGESQTVGKFILKRVRDLRKANIRQVCVVIHADQYWDSVVGELRKSDLPLQLLLTRGERLPNEKPLVVVTKPAFVGGQEFDAVILVGLEQGLVPARIPDNEVLSAAMEQQALREIYLSLTRARFQVIVAVTYGAAVSGIISEAARNGFIDVGRPPSTN